MLYLDDISWSTTELHNMLKIISITTLALSPSCQLTCSSNCPTLTSRIKVNQASIEATMTIDTLASLLSQMEVDGLYFNTGCKVKQMDKYKRLPRVSHDFVP